MPTLRDIEDCFLACPDRLAAIRLLALLGRQREYWLDVEIARCLRDAGGEEWWMQVAPHKGSRKRVDLYTAQHAPPVAIETKAFYIGRQAVRYLEQAALQKGQEATWALTCSDYVGQCVADARKLATEITGGMRRYVLVFAYPATGVDRADARELTRMVNERADGVFAVRLERFRASAARELATIRLRVEPRSPQRAATLGSHKPRTPHGLQRPLAR